MKKGEKRGISSIITTVLLVLIVLVAIGTIWTVVKTSLKTETEKISIDKFSAGLEIQRNAVYVDTSDRALQIQVKRDDSSVNLSYIQILVYGKDDEGNEIIKKYKAENYPSQFETTVYHIYTGDFSKVEKISIFPVLANGEIGLESSCIITEKNNFDLDVTAFEDFLLPEDYMPLNFPSWYYKDYDGDGWSDGVNATGYEMGHPDRYYLAENLAGTTGDCNDSNAAINPGKTDICSNLIDDNCNNMIDETCYFNPSWKKLNNGNPINSYEDIRYDDNGFNYYLKSFITTISTSDGLVYFFDSETLGMIMGRLSNDKKWELLTENSWSSSASAMPKPFSISDALSSSWFAIKPFQFPAPDNRLFGIFMSSDRLGRIYLDVHGELFNFILDGLNVLKWNSGISYSAYAEYPVLPQWAGVRHDFDFNGNNKGLAVASYAFNINKLAASKYYKDATDSNWKSWNGTAWSVRGSPVAVIDSQKSMANSPPKVTYIGNNQYLIAFSTIRDANAGIYDISAALYDDSSDSWQWWNSTGWQLTGNATYSQFISNFSCYYPYLESAVTGNNVSIFASCSGDDKIYEAVYNKESKKWGASKIIANNSKPGHFSAAKDSSNNIWLVYIDKSDSINLIRKYSDVWSNVSRVYNSYRITGININFFNNTPIILFEENKKLYAIADNSSGFWNNEQTVLRTARPDLKALNESKMRFINQTKDYVANLMYSSSIVSAGPEIDNGGRLYFPFTGVCHLVIFNSSTLTPLKFWGGFWDYFSFPSAVAIDNLRGKVYVSDQLSTGAGGYISGRVQVFNKSWENQDLWYRNNYGLPTGTKPAQVYPATKSGFLFPADLAIDEANGLLYVSDTMNNKIQQFNLNQLDSGNGNNSYFDSGRFPIKIRDIGSEGTQQGKFSFPTGIDTDEYGNLYVVDTLNHRIQKFDKNGNYLLNFGSLGFEQGKFIYPFGIAVDKNYNLVYVADPYKKELQIFTKSGQFVYSWSNWNNGEFTRLAGVTANGKGDIFVSTTHPKIDYEQNYLVKFSIVNPNVDANTNKIPDSLE